MSKASRHVAVRCALLAAAAIDGALDLVAWQRGSKVAAATVGAANTEDPKVTWSDGGATVTTTGATLPMEPMEAPVGSAEVAPRQADGTWRSVLDNSLGPAILDALEP